MRELHIQHDPDVRGHLSAQIEPVLLQGYCRNIPCEFVDEVMNIYHYHGFIAAAEVAILLVRFDHSMRTM